MFEAVYEDMEAAKSALKVVSLMVVLFYCLLTHTKSELKQWILPDGRGNFMHAFRFIAESTLGLIYTALNTINV